MKSAKELTAKAMDDFQPHIDQAPTDPQFESIVNFSDESAGDWPDKIPKNSDEKAPGKGQLTTGHSFNTKIKSEKYTPVKDAGNTLTLLRADKIGDPVETADFVQNLLTAGGASVVYGPSNTGKSFWVLELAASVATGRPFMDSMEVDQGAVIYFALEGIHGARNRIHALRSCGRLGAESPLYLCFEPLSLLDQKDVERMIAEIKEVERLDGVPCKLVIIDTLARAMPGGDENQGKDMGKYVYGKDRIRAETGAHVLSVHHSGKNEDNGARGHSSLRAAMDTEIRVSRPSGGLVSLVTVTKQRDLPAINPMAFSLETVELGVDRRGHAITSCVVNPEREIPSPQSKSPGRKAKCTPVDLLSLLPAESVNDWQDRAEKEFGIKRSQFLVQKKTLEKNQYFRKDSVTKLIVAN
jgi:hypothetical protein